LFSLYVCFILVCLFLIMLEFALSCFFPDYARLFLFFVHTLICVVFLILCYTCLSLSSLILLLSFVYVPACMLLPTLFKTRSLYFFWTCLCMFASLNDLDFSPLILFETLKIWGFSLISGTRVSLWDPKFPDSLWACNRTRNPVCLWLWNFHC